MLIIFGTELRHSTAPNAKIVRNACPNCHSDLQKKMVKTYFTLFFLPIFPVNTHAPIYQCVNCKTTFAKTD